MKAKSINLSADLTEALKAQAPYSKRGRTLAQNAISMLDTTVSNVSYELQSEIDRLYYKNFRNDETTAKLSSQLTKIRSDYSILPQKMREDVDSISRNDFSITVFGRTMAGKSTLMEILTHGDGKSIGNGAQRFTRDVRTYSYKKLNITDVPGVAAFEGKDDEDVAFNAAKKCDLIMFLITDDDVQPEVTECLGRIFALGKPVICIINVKQGIADELNDKEMKFFKSRLSRKLDFERLDGIKKQLYEYGSSYGQDWHLIRFAYVHLKAAFMSQQKKYEAYSEELLELSRFSYVDNLIVSEVTNNGGFYNESLQHMKRFIFDYGGYFGGYEKRTYTVTGEKVLFDLEHSLYLKPSNLPIYEPFTKDEFIKGIAELHIGEWKRSYVDPTVLDGTQWSIDIEFEDDHKPVHIDGSNAFPYNFDDLLEFLGVNEEGDEDEV